MARSEAKRARLNLHRSIQMRHHKSIFHHSIQMRYHKSIFHYSIQMRYHGSPIVFYRDKMCHKKGAHTRRPIRSVMTFADAKVPPSLVRGPRGECEWSSGLACRLRSKRPANPRKWRHHPLSHALCKKRKGHAFARPARLKGKSVRIIRGGMPFAKSAKATPPLANHDSLTSVVLTTNQPPDPI